MEKKCEVRILFNQDYKKFTKKIKHKKFSEHKYTDIILTPQEKKFKNNWKLNKKVLRIRTKDNKVGDLVFSSTKKINLFTNVFAKESTKGTEEKIILLKDFPIKKLINILEKLGFTPWFSIKKKGEAIKFFSNNKSIDLYCEKIKTNKSNKIIFSAELEIYGKNSSDLRKTAKKNLNILKSIGINKNSVTHMGLPEIIFKFLSKEGKNE